MKKRRFKEPIVSCKYKGCSTKEDRRSVTHKYCKKHRKIVTRETNKRNYENKGKLYMYGRDKKDLTGHELYVYWKEMKKKPEVDIVYHMIHRGMFG